MKAIRGINEMKSWFLEKINKANKFLALLTRKQSIPKIKMNVGITLYINKQELENNTMNNSIQNIR